MYQSLKACATPFAPATIFLLAYLLAVVIVSASLVAYLLVAISVVSAITLLLVSLAIKLAVVVGVVIALNLAVRTVSDAQASNQESSPLASDLHTNLGTLADGTQKALHHNYGQLCTRLSGLFLWSRTSPRVSETGATALSGPLPWWTLVSQLMAVILEIDLIACKALFGVLGVTLPFAGSVIGSTLGLPDITPQDADVPAPEPSGVSSSVSLQLSLARGEM
ncbi:hypothetical protein DXG01_008926 [Tephrocybe rancida]|nr:hypothetical protein DXG01_008926 [Tephrocybe rancida]